MHIVNSTTVRYVVLCVSIMLFSVITCLQLLASMVAGDTLEYKRQKLAITMVPLSEVTTACY